MRKSTKLGWWRYECNRQHPLVKRGTRLGKRGAYLLWKGAMLRQRAENPKGKKMWRESVEYRAAIIMFYLFKYLGQRREFDWLNDPATPVPIAVLWQAEKGIVRLVSNSIDSNDVITYILCKAVVQDKAAVCEPLLAAALKQQQEHPGELHKKWRQRHRETMKEVDDG